MAKGSTPEGKVKAKVNKIFARYPESYVFMSVPYGYGKSTIDYLACHYGEFIGIETKAPGEAPTPRQEDIIWEIQTARGMTFVIDGDPLQLLELENYLEQVKQNATRPSQPEAPNGRRPVCGQHPEPVPGGSQLDFPWLPSHPPAAQAD